MKTQIEFDSAKISQLMNLGFFSTKRLGISNSIKENIKALRRKELANMFGKIAWEGDLDEWRKSRVPEWDGSQG